MNENDLSESEDPADGDRITQQRRIDDEDLAAHAYRTAYAAGWKRAAKLAIYSLCVLPLAGQLLAMAGASVEAGYLVLFGPTAVGFGLLLRAFRLDLSAFKVHLERPLWERHRIDLVMKRIADPKETP